MHFDGGAVRVRTRGAGRDAGVRDSSRVLAEQGYASDAVDRLVVCAGVPGCGALGEAACGDLRSANGD